MKTILLFLSAIGAVFAQGGPAYEPLTHRVMVFPGPFKIGTSLPATCTVGTIFFKSDATAGQNIYECAATNTWTQQLNSGAGGASTALDNLSSVAINTTLLPQTGVDAGSAAKSFKDLYLYGGGTFGSHSMRFTGTPTGNRVITFQDSSDTVVMRATTDALTNKTINGLTITTSTGTFTVPNGVVLTGPAATGTVMTLGNTETVTGNKTFTGVVDASGASRTAPAKVGTSLPGTCTVGDLYFKSDATAGQNIYECQSTNTWTQQLNSGGGGSGSLVMTTGASDPSANCTAPSSSNLAMYQQTTTTQLWFCDSTNHWTPIPSVDNTHSGSETFGGLTSGAAGFSVNDVAGTAISYILPATNGAANQVLYDTGSATCPTLIASAPATCHQLAWGVLPAASNTVTVLNGSVAYCADAGSTDAYACSLSPAPAGYVTGARYRFKANTANTGAASIEFNSLGAKTIVKVAGGITTALATNDIRVGQFVDLVYDGTNMQMQSLLGNAPSGTGLVDSVNTMTGAVNLPDLNSSGQVVGTNGFTIPASANLTKTSSSGQIDVATHGNLIVYKWIAGGGSANAQTGTYSPAVGGLTDGLELCWKPTAANTTTTPTFSPSGLTAHTIVKPGGALVANDILTTAQACVIYNSTGTQWELQNPQTAQIPQFSGDVVNTGLVNAIGAAKVTPTMLAASDLTTGTTKTFSLNSGYFECTGTCTITMPVPAAGKQYCVRNANNVATVITFAAIGSSAMYENTANTAYGTAGTGTLVSGGAAGDKMCLVGKDSTHYDIWSFNGTWTAN